VLFGSVTSLDCVLAAIEEVGTHTVFFGTVVGCSLTPVDPSGGREILVYHDRHYAEV